MEFNPIIKECPSYSSERYYLLSELEQALSFDILSEITDKEYLEQRGLNIIYFLWDLDKHEDIRDDGNFIKLNELVYGVKKLIIFMEVYDKNIINNTEYDSKILKSLKYLHDHFENCCIVLGVGNKKAGTAALDSCLESINIVKYFLNTMTLWTLTGEEVLGHDAEREPDAESDMIQKLYLNIEPNDWVKKNIKTKTKIVERTHKALDNIKGQTATDQMIFNFITVLIIALTCHTLYTNYN